jgi:hypothetical protein
MITVSFEDVVTTLVGVLLLVLLVLIFEVVAVVLEIRSSFVASLTVTVFVGFSLGFAST